MFLLLIVRLIIKSLGIVILTAGKTQPTLLIERADGDAGRRAKNLRNANGGFDDGGANDGHFYNNWICLYIYCHKRLIARLLGLYLSLRQSPLIFIARARYACRLVSS